MEINNSPPLTCPNTVTIRRNPHRKARPTPISNRPQNLFPSLSSSSPNPAQIPSFPLQEILAIEIPPDAKEELSSSSSPPKASPSEKLKVYLRVRPLLPSKNLGKCSSAKDDYPKSRAKNAWPQNPAKKNAAREKSATKKNREACITITDSQSVTLSPPLPLQESKRIKSEIYEGFSHVFSPESSQTEVYEKMVNPLVEDFLRGKSGMLAALGPSGSGKTHTIFGSLRQPGMVPLALQHIFKQRDRSTSESSRSFYLSIFEIYLDRSKGEKILDLLQGGAELNMLQSTIKGLEEVIISDAKQAESSIACALLKRATATTNTNSNSSRSQCVINIRSGSITTDGVDVQSKPAVFTIVDLAGAEREKRTGNQGARLLESNFINNTSMVFGLCLKALFEHQKNPKKPLQKHFQYSTLTKYMRDYLEGKKRMTLILTVKPGEEDYLDTSFLLRQASPYTKIKFNNAEKSTNLLTNKRQLQTFAMLEQQPKKLKVEGKTTADENNLAQEDALDINKNPSPNLQRSELAAKDNSHLVMHLIVKVLLNSLYQYKGKLEISEREIKSLRGKLRNERKKYFELDNTWENLNHCCTCSKENDAGADSINLDGRLESGVTLKECQSNDVLKVRQSEDDVVDTSSPHGQISDQTENQSSSEAKVVMVECLNQTCESKQPEDNTLRANTEDYTSRTDTCRKEAKPSNSATDTASIEESNVVEDTPCKREKPKRRLLPSSSILLKDLTLHLDDDVEKPKGSWVGKVSTVHQNNKTQGSLALMHLLKKNLKL